MIGEDGVMVDQSGEQNPYDQTQLDSEPSQTEAPAEEPESSSPLDRLPELANGNVILVVLVAAGILGVYLLSLRGGPPKASAKDRQNEVKVDAALTQMKLMSQSDRESRAVVDTFYYEAKQRQIAEDQLNGNPFADLPPMTPEQLPNSSAIDLAALAEQKRQAEEARKKAEALEAVAELNLETVLFGQDGRIAIISGDLVTEGQTLNGWRVGRIQTRSVELRLGPHRHLLTLQQ
jgi:Tfp pilus assembly protein PilV